MAVVDLDTFLGFWLEDVPYVYIEGADETTTYRYYITPKGRPINRNLSDSCSWVSNFFMTISLFEVYRYRNDKQGEIRINGKKYDDYVWLHYFDPHLYTEIVSSDGTSRTDLRDKLMKPSLKKMTKIEFKLLRSVIPFKRPTVKRQVVAYYDDIINMEFPRAPYNPKERPPNIHWGQMKLVLTEIEFLTEYADKLPIIVLYIGGAPGNHIPYLSMLFPNVLFVLYDPLPFGIEETSRIVIHQKYFTDEDAELVKRTDCLLISDIRTPEITETEFLSSHPALSLPRDRKTVRDTIEKQFSKDILRDMELQKRWTEMIRPRSAMLKFRLGFPPPKTQTYLASPRIVIQPFAKITSTEQRLWLERKDSYETKEYDLQVVEERCFYFNTKYRPATFYDIDPLFGYNYDTLRSANILRKYITSIGLGIDTNLAIYSMIYGIETVIGRSKDTHQITDLLTQRYYM